HSSRPKFFHRKSQGKCARRDAGAIASVARRHLGHADFTIADECVVESDALQSGKRSRTGATRVLLLLLARHCARIFKKYWSAASAGTRISGERWPGFATCLH